MSQFWRRIANLLIVLVLAGGAVTTVTGCREEGPAEEIGENVDEAVEDAGEAVENAGEGA